MGSEIMANTKTKTITEVDFLQGGAVRATMRVEWPDANDVVDADDTQMKNKVFEDYASTPQKVKDFVVASMA